MHDQDGFVGVNSNDEGNNIVKEATQVNGHSLKLHFSMFKRSQVKHNSLDCHNFFGMFSINCNVYMFKF
jgi:hypothetical protein